MTKKKHSTQSNRAFLYVRVSTLDQSDKGHSLDAQIERLIAYCTYKGFEIVDVFREEAVSGGKPLEDRPQGKLMLQRMAAEDIGNIVSAKLDRLFRNALNCLKHVEAWEQAGITLHLTDMNLDTSTSTGKFFLTLMAGVAEMERNLIRERTQAVMDSMKMQGKAYSATPYGFGREGDTFIINEEEQAVIQRMVVLKTQAGLSWNSIATVLNEDHVPTKTGAPWSRVTIQTIVERVTGPIAGDRHHRTTAAPEVIQAKAEERIARITAHAEAGRLSKKQLTTFKRIVANGEKGRWKQALTQAEKLLAELDPA